MAQKKTGATLAQNPSQPTVAEMMRLVLSTMRSAVQADPTRWSGEMQLNFGKRPEEEKRQ